MVRGGLGVLHRRRDRRDPPGRARFSITARKDPSVRRAIAAHPRGRVDPDPLPAGDLGRQTSSAGSPTPRSPRSTTPRSRPGASQAVTARLIVRRVRRLAPAGHGRAGRARARPGATTPCSPTARSTMLQAEADHRRHAIIEQVIADLNDGPLAHLPSGMFTANAAWLVLAAIALNLIRAAGALASPLHAKATTGTIRRQLISVPARIAHSARRIILHLPAHWPWQPPGGGCSPTQRTTHTRTRLTTQPARPDRRTPRGKAGQTGEIPMPQQQPQHQDHQLAGAQMSPWIQAEEEGAEAFFPLRAENEVAGSKARCASGHKSKGRDDAEAFDQQEEGLRKGIVLRRLSDLRPVELFAVRHRTTGSSGPKSQ